MSAIFIFLAGLSLTWKVNGRDLPAASSFYKWGQKHRKEKWHAHRDTVRAELGVLWPSDSVTFPLFPHSFLSVNKRRDYLKYIFLCIRLFFFAFFLIWIIYIERHYCIPDRVPASELEKPWFGACLIYYLILVRFVTLSVSWKTYKTLKNSCLYISALVRRIELWGDIVVRQCIVVEKHKIRD